MHVLDLFSGIGGFSLGLHRAGGFRTVAFCERDRYARLVLGKHWPGVPIYPDVQSLSAATLTLDGVPRPDIVCGGFPCQDISLAGRGAGLAGERSGLWFEFQRIIAETQPRWVIIENVAALRARGLDSVLGGLAAIGYDAEWHCIPASALGAPHRRDRVWIVAYSNGGAGRGHARRFPAARLAAGRKPDNLPSQVKLWPTPQASDEKPGQAARVGDPARHGGWNLRDWVKLWPTPAARDYRAPNAPGGPSRLSRPPTSGEQLPNAVGGVLNPEWVELLMGYPLGWTVTR